MRGRIRISLTVEFEGVTNFHLIIFRDVRFPRAVWKEEITFSMLSMVIQSVDSFPFLSHHRLSDTHTQHKEL